MAQGASPSPKWISNEQAQSCVDRLINRGTREYGLASRVAKRLATCMVFGPAHLLDQVRCPQADFHAQLMPRDQETIEIQIIYILQEDCRYDRKTAELWAKAIVYDSHPAQVN